LRQLYLEGVDELVEQRKSALISFPFQKVNQLFRGVVGAAKITHARTRGLSMCFQ
jgi:hypothetical protein